MGQIAGPVQPVADRDIIHQIGGVVARDAQEQRATLPEMIFIIAFELPMLVGLQILVAGIDPVLGEIAGGDEIVEIELAHRALDAQPELAGIRRLPAQKRARLEESEAARGDALRCDGGVFHSRAGFQRPIRRDLPARLHKGFAALFIDLGIGARQHDQSAPFET